MRIAARLAWTVLAALPLCAAAIAASPTASRPTADGRAPVYRYRIVGTYPHDRAAFTQGLVFDDGFLYEGTGLLGRSSIRKTEIETGKVLQQRRLADSLFGEGITIMGDRLYQLTWKSQTGFVYDKATLRVLSSFHYEGEGWGLTNDGTHLIMSNGSATLTRLDPESFKPVGLIRVRDNGRPVTWLNELEYINGEIFANVWQTDRIARISPESGAVTGWLDLRGLLGNGTLVPYTDVLNGIAYDPANRRLFVTGKRWPKLFEIEIVPPAARRAAESVRK